jgi:hypothetical protein
VPFPVEMGVWSSLPGPRPIVVPLVVTYARQTRAK